MIGPAPQALFCLIGPVIAISAVDYSDGCPGSGPFVSVDRSHSGFDHDILHSRTFPVDAGEELEIRVILDRFSGEFFLNGGRQAFSMTLYTPQEFDGITFAAEGNASITVEKYDIHI